MFSAGFTAAQTCSPSDTRGTYLLKTSGWQDLGPSHPSLPNTMGPTYGLGIMTLDGTGKGSGRGTITLGGVAQTVEYLDVQYSVREDCGGTVSYRLKVAGTETALGPDKVELRVLDDGTRLAGLMTDAAGRGAILTFEFRRLSRGPHACHPSMLRGTYSLRYEGWINMQMLNPSQAPYFAPEYGLGVLILDPDGTNRGSAVHNWGGVQLATELAQGTFNVSADCTGVFDYVMQVRGTQNRMSGKSVFVLSGDGAQLSVLMMSPPGFQYYDRVSIP